MVVTLATADDASVTMRLISPAYCDGSILVFTSRESTKYAQLLENPNCCISAGPFFAEARAEFLGATMLDSNKAYRDIYSAKFPGAFDEGLAFGGHDADFILLKPTHLSGWAFENETPTPDGIPTVPFSIDL